MTNSNNNFEKYKRIPLSQGMFAIVDINCFDYLNQWNWSATKSTNGKTYYAVRSIIEDGKSSSIRMHRIITSASKGLQVDHVNGNGLDNRQENLRICTREQNQRNRGPNRGSASIYKGVTWASNANRWRGQIVVDRKRVHLGYFNSEREAALAYDEASKKYHGDFCYTNF